MSDATQELNFTPAEAIKYIKNLRGKNKWIFISVGQHAPIKDDPDHYFPVIGNVKVTREVAMKFVDDTYSNFADRGAVVRIGVLDNCVFIGRPA